MSYVVLARRWRPRHFEEVVGQEHVARTLRNAIEQDRVAHAFLFCGPRGVGKTSTARILTKALNCAQGPTVSPCYACPSCEEIHSGSSVDVIEIDGASNRGVNEIRELREGVRYAPSRDRYKIYIIDEVHMLTTEAFNALLKTLEEPPSHVKFIFATTEPQKIPVTILSRCQRFDFKRVPSRKIMEHLRRICEAEGIEAEEGALTLIARQADGGVRDSLSLTDQVISFCDGRLSEDQVAQVLGVAGREVLFELTQALLEGEVEQALRVLDRVNQAGYDMRLFASSLVEHIRDLTVVKVSRDPEILTDLTERELARAQAQLDVADMSVLHRMFAIMVQAAEAMSRSAYPKLVFEMTLVKLASIEPLMPLEPLLQRLEALEGGLLIGDLPEDPPPGPGGAGGPAGPSGGGLGGGGRGQGAAGHSARGATREEASAPQRVRGSTPTEVKPRIQRTAMASAPTPQALGAAAFEAEASVEAEASIIQMPNAAPARVAQQLESTGEVARAGGGSGHLRIVSGGAASQPHASPPQAPAQHAPSSTNTSADGEPGTEARDRWRRVVKEVNRRKHVVARVFEQAQILTLAPGLVRLQLDPGYRPLAEEHEGLVRDAARDVLGDAKLRFEVSYGTAESTEAQRSLAQEDDEIERARLAKARETLLQTPIVQRAQAIFSARDVRVVLDDDDVFV